ncbi:hypothetical protein B0H14DRAFT_3685585 [Mycena olivaceomarginata]|nr:hypothetical protein B0H14DRAFT_3685585 [Mycena olivaceomarginata]
MLIALDLHSINPVVVDSSTLYTARSSLIRALTQVQSLKMATIYLRAFGHLGQLRTLETLHIEIPPSISFNGVADQMLFTNLCEAEFDVWQGDIGQLNRFCAHVQTIPAQVISVSLNSYPSQKDIGDLYHALALHCAHNCLQVLKLELFKVNIVVTYPPSSMHPANVLRHLHIANLVIVSIHVPTGFDLDDITMVLAWPYLKELVLKTDAQPNLPWASLLGLQALSESCPNFQKLEITLDVTSIPTPSADPQGRDFDSTDREGDEGEKFDPTD